MITTRQNWLGPDPRNARLTGCLLGLVACAVFLPAVWCGFVDWDDAAYVVENPLVMSGLSATGIRDACTRVVFGFWAPLTILSYQLDASLYGMKPWGFHLTNVILHGISTGLLYLALFSMTGAPRRCAAVVLLFALHPLRAESVVWIAERKDVLSMVFLTLTLLAYARYCRQPSAARFGGVFLAMLAGCLAKSSLVTLPVLLLLVDLWPLARGANPFTPRNDATGERTWAEFLSSWRPLLIEKLPLFGLSATFAAITLLTHAYALDTSVAARPASERLGHSLNSIAWYLLHTLWPTGLHPMHHHFEPMLSPGAVAVASLMVAVPIAIALFRPAARPAVVVGLGWFLVALLPTLGIFGRVGVAPYADRFTYIPHIGLMLAVVWSAAAMTDAASKPATRWASAAAAALIALLCTFIVIDESQIRIWRNSETLFQHTVAAESGNFMAHFQYGETLRRRGDLPRAMAEFRLSLQAMEGRRVTATKRSAVHNALGVALRDDGRVTEADAEFERALSLDPTNRLARTNIGIALAKSGHPEKAVEQFASLAASDPTDVDALHNLVVTHTVLGNLAESLAACRRLVALQPRRADPRARLGQLLMMAGDPAAALAELRRAAQLDPHYPGIGALIAEAREALAQPQSERSPVGRPADGMPPGAARPAVRQQAAPKRLSLHAAPAGDTAALNADGARRLPAALAKAIHPNGRPGVIIFLKADCECSRGFAVTATALAPHLREFATCTAVIEGTVADADAFAAATGLAMPFIAQPESELAREWGVTKAGCFALVEPDGSVEAVWPGISRQGFRDLASRIGVEPPLPEALLAEIPGAAMAGCPLEYVAVGPAALPMPDRRPDLSPETTQ